MGLVSAVAQTLPQAPPGGGDDEKWDISQYDTNKLPAAATTTGVTFDKDIQPLFKASCDRCHGAQRPRGGLQLTSLESALKGGRDGKMIVPGDSSKSIAAAAAQIDPHIAMPPKPRRGPGGPRWSGGPGGQGVPSGSCRSRRPWSWRTGWTRRHQWPRPQLYPTAAIDDGTSGIAARVD